VKVSKPGLHRVGALLNPYVKSSFRNAWDRFFKPGAPKPRIMEAGGTVMHWFEDTDEQVFSIGLGFQIFNEEATPEAMAQFQIRSKYLIDPNTAYRGKLSIGFGRTPDTLSCDQDPLQTTIAIGAGIEKRVGSTRIVGVYGAELNYSFGMGQEEMEFNKELRSLGPGMSAFVGVEWFFAPKISLSGEYTWGLSLATEVTTITEQHGSDGSSPTVVPSHGETKTSTFSIDTGVSGGTIMVNFYFQ
jgi:hypothetical protein